MVYPPDTLNRFIPSGGINSYIPRIVLGRILYFVIPASVTFQEFQTYSPTDVQKVINNAPSKSSAIDQLYTHHHPTNSSRTFYLSSPRVTPTFARKQAARHRFTKTE